jgi:glycosyltransferase involved in cell wall biosynthesis
MLSKNEDVPTPAPDHCHALPDLTLTRTMGSPYIVSLSAVAWEFPLVGRTRMLTEAWQRQEQPAIFVQVPSYRTALERLTRRFSGAERRLVLRPWPTYPSLLWNALGDATLLRSIRSRSEELRRQLERLVAFHESVALVVTPVWVPWLDALPFRAVVYDCIDDLSVHIPRASLARRYRRWEAELIERAAGAVVSATELDRRLRSRRPDLLVRVIRNGVDAERFERQACEISRPADLPERGRPIVGFVGALFDWVDRNLIVAVARELPDFDFVFVGPSPRGRRDLPKGANLHFLGPRPYSRVPSYLNAFDVCWVPFKRDSVAHVANPVKIYEYLALGKPVVTTPIADLESFEGLVTTAASAAEVAEELRSAAAAGGDAERRRAFARANSWEARAAQYASFLEAIT